MFDNQSASNWQICLSTTRRPVGKQSAEAVGKQSAYRLRTFWLEKVADPLLMVVGCDWSATLSRVTVALDTLCYYRDFNFLFV